MSSSFLHLAVGSRDLSQAEKKLMLLQAEQIHTMKTVFTNYDPVVILSENSYHFDTHLLLSL